MASLFQWKATSHVASSVTKPMLSMQKIPSLIPCISSYKFSAERRSETLQLELLGAMLQVDNSDLDHGSTSTVGSNMAASLVVEETELTANSVVHFYQELTK